MKGSSNLIEVCSSKKRYWRFIIIFLLIFNFLIPIILNSNIISDNTTQELLNFDLFNRPKDENPTIPNIPLKTLSNGEYIGYGNNRSVTAFSDNKGTINGNATDVIIETNGWDILSPNFTIDQLTAHNHTKVLEDQASFSNDASTNLYLMSFNVSQDANLTEVKFLLRSQVDNATIFIYSSNTSIAPDTQLYKINISGFDAGLGSGTWINFTLSDKNYLNVSQTNNDTFFIGINRTFSTLQWRGDNDGADGGKVFFLSGSIWQEELNRDLALEIKLTPLNETPNPNDIDLKINGQNVLSNFTWKNSSRYNATGTNNIFDIDSNWGNITYRANWTATFIRNLNGIANYSANAIQNKVYWNVTISNINFVTGSQNKQINISLPSDWNISAVFYGLSPYGNFDNVTENNLKILRIFNPPNSSWSIDLESPNYINLIKLYKGLSKVNSSLILEEITVNGTMQNNCYNGFSNLTILLDSVVRNTTTIIPNGNLSINVALNDSFNILKNGTYTFRLTFSNGTVVGINETYLNILNRSNIDDISPDAQKVVFYSSEILDIAINFTMSYWNGLNFIWQPIDNLTGGNVTYNFPEITGNRWIPLTYNPVSKVWNTPIPLNIDIGKYTFYVNASKEGVEYQITSREIVLIHFNGTLKGAGDPRPIIIQGYENDTKLKGDESLIQLPTRGHNLTYANFTIYNISSISERIIENSYFYNYLNITDKTFAMKFNISKSSVLSKVDFQLYISHLTSTQLTNLSVYLWNATWNISRIEPDKIIWSSLNNSATLGPYIQRIFELDIPDIFLNISQTHNNSYFLTVNGTPIGGLGKYPHWVYTNDTEDGIDEGEAYNYTGGGWTLIDKDFWMNITLYEFKNSSQLALNISGIPVADNPNRKYSGFWESNNTYIASPSGNVSLSVQANETEINYLVNYTIRYENNSVDSLTLYTFNITESVVKWNITFIATLPNFAFNGTINVTYPKTWNISLIYTPNKVNYSQIEILNLGHSKVLLIKDFNSTLNGSWNLLFYSNKFTSDIWIWNNTGTGYQQCNLAYMTDNIKFNASVTNAINGIANLSFFSANNTLYNLRSLDSPTVNGSYDFPDWRIMDNLTTDGNCTVLFLWTNGTEVAGKITFLYVQNASSLFVISPEPPELQGNIIEGVKGSTINLSVYFNMTFWDNGWTSIPLSDSPSNTVSYQTNSLDITSPLTGNLTYVGNGTWTKLFNVPIINASYYIFINATRENVQPSSINFTIIVANYSSFEITPSSQSVYWGENVTYSLNYTDQTDGSPITNANLTEINYTIASLSKSGILFENVNYSLQSQNGIYNITILSGTLSNYTYDLVFKINKIGFQPRSATGILYVNNRTTTLTLVTAPIPIYLGDNVSFVISYNDSLDNSGISNATIKTNASALLDISWAPVVGEAGNYNVTLNSSNFNNIGDYLLEFNASKAHHNIAYLNVIIQVTWFYTNLTPISGINGTPYDWKINVTLNSSHKVQVNYLNLWDKNPIQDALIDAYFEGNLLSTSQLGNGNYSIILDATIISNPDINENYTLNITMYKTGYETQTINISVNFLPLPTILTPIQDYINATHNDVISIDVLLTDSNLKNIGPNYGNVTYYITNSSGKKYINGTCNYQSGYYHGSEQLLSTDLENGTYWIYVKFNSSFNFYLNSSCLITLNFSVATPIIPTIIEFINLPRKVNESTYLFIILNLTNSQKTETIPSGLVEITIIASFEDGSTLTNITNTQTNDSGIIELSFFVPLEAISISVSANYYGSSQYEQSSNSTSIIVIRQGIFLTIIPFPPLFVPEGMPLLIFGKIGTENGTIPNGTIVINVFFNILRLNFNLTPSSTGFISFIVPIPTDIFSVSVTATYYGTKGYKIEGTPRSVAILNDLEFFIRENFESVLFIFLIITLVIIGLITYFRAIRPKTEPLTAKKKRLMEQRAEVAKELSKITRELDKLRSETLAQAQKAERDGLFEEAALAYEKVGNLSLELAEKSIAKDYFARSRALMKKVSKEELQAKRKEERKNLIGLARNALRERKILKASKIYSKIVAISIQLGDLETAQKFSNLIASTEDQIQMLQEQELRTELKHILSKADKAMGKQKFSAAAENFEEASRLLLLLNEPEGVRKFSGWAKLARERQEIFSGIELDWKAQLHSIIEETKINVEKKKEEADYDQVILNLLKIAIYYLELEDENKFREYRQKARSYSNKLKIFRTDRKAKIESEKLEIIQKAEKAEAENKFKLASELYENAAKLAIKFGDRYEGKQLMNKAQILLKQAKKWEESEKMEELEELIKPIKPPPKKEIKPIKPMHIPELPKPKPIKPITERIKIPEIKVLRKPVENKKISLKPKIIEKPVKIPKPTPKEKPRFEEEKIKEIRKQIDKLHTLIFDCQKEKRFNTALYYYKKASNLAKQINDNRLLESYSLKIEEMNALIQKKIESRDKIRKLIDASENYIRKEKYSKAIKQLKTLAEIFFSMGDEQAGIDFLERIAELRNI